MLNEELDDDILHRCSYRVTIEYLVDDKLLRSASRVNINLPKTIAETVTVASICDDNTGEDQPIRTILESLIYASTVDRGIGPQALANLQLEVDSFKVHDQLPLENKHEVDQLNNVLNQVQLYLRGKDNWKRLDYLEKVK